MIVNNFLLKLFYVDVEGERATVMKIAQYVWTFKEYNTRVPCLIVRVWKKIYSPANCGCLFEVKQVLSWNKYPAQTMYFYNCK